ncbi:hypothetical protein [Aquibacillus albus]|uniref:HEAT repeat domain-containing protein n=1 Tax=Aquibacillus albus TaxID=1168171 RepID=A0ABS2N4C2_9BACI|nr:hypothetical protein [Aquibacillus albus]MBM7572976.1 hypothetical protein [Aquibacillus albus]
MFINLQAAYWMIGILLMLMLTVAVITLIIKLNKKRFKKKEEKCLSGFRSYLDYLQIQLDNEARLRSPRNPLSYFEKEVLQKTLLQWVDRLDGIHRQKLLTLCEDIGLIEHNRKRLRSRWTITRIDAAYHLGILRDSGSTPELFSMLYQEKFKSSVYIIARSIAQTSKEPNEIKGLIQYLVENGNENIHLIADISKESSLDLRSVYVSFLYEEQAQLNKVGLISLQDQIELDLPENIHSFVQSDDKGIRILAAKLLMTSMVLKEQDIREYLQFPDWEIRNLFTEWIGNSELIQYAELLKDRVQDSNWLVSRSSAKSLVQLGSRGFEILCEIAVGLYGERGRKVANEFIEEDLKQSIDRFSQLNDMTVYNNKLYTYQKYFGKNDDLTKAI